MTEKEIQDAKTASDKRELERRYVAKKYPLNLKGFESEQAQADIITMQIKYYLKWIVLRIVILEKVCLQKLQNDKLYR